MKRNKKIRSNLSKLLAGMMVFVTVVTGSVNINTSSEGKITPSVGIIQAHADEPLTNEEFDKIWNEHKDIDLSHVNNIGGTKHYYIRGGKNRWEEYRYEKYADNLKKVHSSLYTADHMAEQIGAYLGLDKMQGADLNEIKSLGIKKFASRNKQQALSEEQEKKLDNLVDKHDNNYEFSDYHLVGQGEWGSTYHVLGPNALNMMSLPARDKKVLGLPYGGAARVALWLLEEGESPETLKQLYSKYNTKTAKQVENGKQLWNQRQGVKSIPNSVLKPGTDKQLDIFVFDDYVVSEGPYSLQGTIGMERLDTDFADMHGSDYNQFSVSAYTTKQLPKGLTMAKLDQLVKQYDARNADNYYEMTTEGRLLMPMGGYQTNHCPTPNVLTGLVAGTTNLVSKEFYNQLRSKYGVAPKGSVRLNSFEKYMNKRERPNITKESQEELELYYTAKGYFEKKVEKDFSEKYLGKNVFKDVDNKIWRNLKSLQVNRGYHEGAFTPVTKQNLIGVSGNYTIGFKDREVFLMPDGRSYFDSSTGQVKTLDYYITSPRYAKNAKDAVAPLNSIARNKYKGEDQFLSVSPRFFIEELGVELPKGHRITAFYTNPDGSPWENIGVNRWESVDWFDMVSLATKGRKPMYKLIAYAKFEGKDNIGVSNIDFDNNGRTTSNAFYGLGWVDCEKLGPEYIKDFNPDNIFIK